jgi:DHA2 family multidrug resistance protein
VEWVVTGYLLALGVAQAATGWVGARFGDRKAFLGSLSLFAASSAVAAAAPNLWALIVARTIQGICGGIAMPLSASLLFAMFPPRNRGRVIGISGTVIMVAPGLGPVLSGYVVDNFSWRWLLLLNVPVGVAGVLFGLRLIPEVSRRRPRPFDLRGLVLMAGGLIGLLVAISQASEWGFSSVRFIGLAAIAVALIWLYTWHSRRVEHPLIDPVIFTEPVFRTTILITWALASAQFARMVFVPLELQVVRGMSAFEAGAILAVAAVGSAIIMPFAGWLTDRTGGRLPVAAGGMILAVAMLRLGTLELETATWQVIAAVGATGVGIVLVTMTSTVTGLNWVSHRFGNDVVGEASAVRNLHRQIAGSIATAGLAVVVTGSGGSLARVEASAAELAQGQNAYNRVFLVALVGVLVATALSRRLPAAPPPDPDDGAEPVIPAESRMT